jgi:hypothetical protein
MKKALIIAYDFPPARTGGVYRPVKFAKYLPEFGWTPVILTVKNYPKETLDSTLLNELPNDIKIYRAFSFEFERFENWAIKKLYNRHSNPETMTNSAAQVTNAPTTSNPSLIKRLLFLPLHRFIENYIHIPDTKIGWIPLAVWVGLRAIRREKIDIIFSTSPPETVHLVARILSKLSGIPLITDFRDPWTTHYTRQDMNAFRTRREKILEQKVLTSATAIIHTGEGRARLVKEAFPKIDVQKHHVIFNGYDEADFNCTDTPDLGNIFENGRFNLVSVGFIYPDTAFEYFMEGFSSALQNPAFAEKAKLILVGEQSLNCKELLSRPDLKPFITNTGFRPHNEAVACMAKADLLLLLIPKGDERMSDKIIAGRTFEYIRSGCPILMIGWDGESTRIIKQSGLGNFIIYNDVDKIAKVLHEYLQDTSNGQTSYKPNWDYITQFERRQLTKRLADLFEASLTNKGK